jgi:hypothetical protein
MHPIKRAAMIRPNLESAITGRVIAGFSGRGGLSLIVNVGFGRF